MNAKIKFRTDNGEILGEGLKTYISCSKSAKKTKD